MKRRSFFVMCDKVVNGHFTMVFGLETTTEGEKESVSNGRSRGRRRYRVQPILFHQNFLK
jgi:hypothetical protein